MTKTVRPPPPDRSSSRVGRNAPSAAHEVPEARTERLLQDHICVPGGPVYIAVRPTPGCDLADLTSDVNGGDFYYRGLDHAGQPIDPAMAPRAVPRLSLNRLMSQQPPSREQPALSCYQVRLQAIPLVPRLTIAWKMSSRVTFGLRVLFYSSTAAITSAMVGDLPQPITRRSSAV